MPFIYLIVDKRIFLFSVGIMDGWPCNNSLNDSDCYCVIYLLHLPALHRKDIKI